MTVTKFPTLDNSAASPSSFSDSIELGPALSTSVEQVINGGFIDNVPTAVSGCTFSVYKSGESGSPTARKSFDMTTGNNVITFDAPVTLEADTTYFIQIHMPDGSYKYVAAPISPAHAEGTFTLGLFGDDDGNPVSFFKTPVDSGAATPPVTRGGFSGNENINWHGIGVWWDDEAEPPEDTPLSLTTVSPKNVDTGNVASLVATPHDATGTVDYEWEQTSGTPTLTITNPTSASASVTPSADGAYVFTVTGTDDNSSDTATVTVNATAPSEEPEEPSDNTISIIAGGVTYGPFSPAGVGGDPPYRLRPEAFGAVGDGVTDDTEAFKLCAAELVNVVAPANNHYAEMALGAKEYAVSSPSDPGYEHGNAQIPIPYVKASTTHKVTLAIRGPGDNAQFIEWAQLTPQSAGAVIKSTWDPAEPSGGIYGTPAVLGGPTYLDDVDPQDAFKTVSNMMLVLDGVQIQVKHDAYLGGFNAKCMAQLVVKTASVISDRTYSSSPMMNALPTHDFCYGLYAPANGNNARTQIDCFIAEGLSVAMYTGEHVAINYLGAVYCGKGLYALATGNDYTWPDGTQQARAHTIWIGRFLAEGVKEWIVNDGFDGQLIINSFDGEGGEGVGENFDYHIVDPENKFVGEIHFAEIFSQSPVVDGAERLRIISDQQVRGARTAPSVPVSDVALQNPFWRDADVYISGGIVTAIEVDDLDIGVTSGYVSVPTGQTIKLTYSSAPTWTWVLR